MSHSEKTGMAWDYLAHESALAARCLSPQAAGYAVRLILRIENYPHILQAYGQAAADTALAHVRRCLLERFRAGALPHEAPSIASGGGGTLAVAIARLGLLEEAVFGRKGLSRGHGEEHPQTVGAICDHAIEWFCAIVSAQPVTVPLKEGVSSAVVHLVLAGSWALPGEAAADDHDVLLRRHVSHMLDAGQGVRWTMAWATRYRADMAVAARVLAAIAVPPGAAAAPSERLVLEWQPVGDASLSGAVLHYHARPCLLTAEGARYDLSDARQALERIGLAHLLDRHVLSRIMDELNACSGLMLGVTLSAHSLCGALWWDDVYARLAGAPDMARRLIVTLAELGDARMRVTYRGRAMRPDTGHPHAVPCDSVKRRRASAGIRTNGLAHHPVSGLACAARFIQAMRGLGCMVAIDDAGVGTVPLRELANLAPDIVRIGDFFFTWSRLELCQAGPPVAPASGLMPDGPMAMPLAGGGVFAEIVERDARKPRYPAPGSLRCLGWVGGGKANGCFPVLPSVAVPSAARGGRSVSSGLPSPLAAPGRSVPGLGVPGDISSADMVMAAWQVLASLDAGLAGRTYDSASSAFRQAFSRQAFAEAIAAACEEHRMVLVFPRPWRKPRSAPAYALVTGMAERDQK